MNDRAMVLEVKGTEGTNQDPRRPRTPHRVQPALSANKYLRLLVVVRPKTCVGRRP